MEFSLQKKIEEMRKQPEDVRKRYVVVSVSFFMVIVFGIWLLSMEDNVATIAKNIPTAVEKGKNLTGAGSSSLNDLFQQSAPLRINNEDQNTTGSEFFNQQYDEKPSLPSQ